MDVVTDKSSVSPLSVQPKSTTCEEGALHGLSDSLISGIGL